VKRLLTQQKIIRNLSSYTLVFCFEINMSQGGKVYLNDILELVLEKACSLKLIERMQFTNI